MAWGLEARVPFLDKTFLDVAMTINPEEKVFREGRMEKVNLELIIYTWNKIRF
jgi:asparagine synthase (glutamine-hydrolysing)